MNHSVISGVGGYLPRKIVTNDDLAKIVDTSHEWIVQRTGIHKRHFAEGGEMTSDLAVEAAKRALLGAGVSPSQVDVVIVATVTPDMTFPSTATIVQKKLGMITGYAFDVAAACTGYLTALNLGDNFIKTGQAKRVLIIGAETFSRILDMQDRRTCVLFGDGAGAILLTSESGPSHKDQRGVIGVSLNSDGAFQDILYVDGGPSSSDKVGVIRMTGKEVYRHAVTKLASSAEHILNKFEISKDQIDWLVPHQANIRIIEGLAKRFQVPWQKVICTVDHHANTSAASIPLALSEAYKAGKLKKGDLILHDAIGGGLVWGSALVRW